MDITLDFAIKGGSKKKQARAFNVASSLKKKNGADEGRQGPHSRKNDKSWRGCVGYVQIKRTISR